VNAEEILNNTDPQELRNLIRRLSRNQLAGNRAVPTIVINEAPNQYPPLPSDIGSDLGWFNVKDYGAIGDGVANDTIAINSTIAALNTAARGVLYFPAGAYLCSSGLTTITAACLILGDGMQSLDNAQYASKVICSSGTANLFSMNTKYARFQGLALINTAGSVTAGSGITVTSSYLGARVDYQNVSVYGFYINVDVQVGAEWVMDQCSSVAPILYALKIQNTVNPDAGDWSVTNSDFISGVQNATAGIRIESSGGGKITGCKINALPGGMRFTYGIDVALIAITTSILLIANTSVENINTNGIRAGGGWYYIGISNCQIALYTANNTSAIKLTGTDHFLISNCTLVYTVPGASSQAAIDLTTCTNGYISGIIQRNFTAKVSQASCSNITEADPASSVTTETSYGLSPAVGISTYWARQDHTHGSPALSTATPQDVADTAAAGSGATPSKNDHVHKGVHSINGLYGDVTLSTNGGAGQVSAIARWVSSGGATYELPDVAEAVQNVFDNGSLVDPLIYSLSSDGTQIIFDSAVTSTHVVVADYIVAQV